jgi:cytoskeleton protein RodZ
MTFAELGDAFRRERERRGLSVEAVAGRLKLMPRVVRAIEQGEADALPQAAYARGFVKAYGSLLELDAEQVLAALEDVRPDDGERAPFAVYGHEEEAKGASRRFFGIVFLMLVPVLLGAGVFWYLRDADPNFSRIVNTAVPAMPEETPAAPPASREPPPPPEGKSEETAAQAPPAASPPSVAAAGPSTRPSAGRESAAVRSGDPHTIIIVALAECWVHSNADDTDTRQFSLHKGDTFVLAFSKKLVLKLGNAGGVRIRFNGRDMPPPGESGQVKTLVFPPAS